jgi:bifunctional DNase/RNase
MSFRATVDAVRVAGTPEGPVPVVVLRVEDCDDVVPIFVGFEEATSIARGMDATPTERPFTHDLCLDVVEELGGRIEKVVVAAIEDNTYIADLHLNTPREDVAIDSRPSDALALAVRTTARVEVTEAVFEDSSEPAEEFDRLDDIRDVDEIQIA